MDLGYNSALFLFCKDEGIKKLGCFINKTIDSFNLKVLTVLLNLSQFKLCLQISILHTAIWQCFLMLLTFLVKLCRLFPNSHSPLEQ